MKKLLVITSVAIAAYSGDSEEEPIPANFEEETIFAEFAEFAETGSGQDMNRQKLPATHPLPMLITMDNNLEKPKNGSEKEERQNNQIKAVQVRTQTPDWIKNLLLRLNGFQSNDQEA
jgi:hypothetical protein